MFRSERDLIWRDARGTAQQGPQYGVTDDETSGITLENEPLRPAALFVRQEVFQLRPLGMFQRTMPQVDPVARGQSAHGSCRRGRVVHPDSPIWCRRPDPAAVLKPDFNSATEKERRVQ